MELDDNFIKMLKKAFTGDITSILESGNIQNILDIVSKAKHAGFYIPNLDGSADFTLNPDPITISINTKRTNIYRYNFPVVEYPDIPEKINDENNPVPFMDYLARRIGKNLLVIRMLKDENIRSQNI